MEGKGEEEEEGGAFVIQNKTLAQLVQESQLNAQWQVTSLDEEDLQSEAGGPDRTQSQMAMINYISAQTNDLSEITAPEDNQAQSVNQSGTVT